MDPSVKKTNKQITKKKTPTNFDFNSRALFDWTILRAVNYPIYKTR